MNETENICPNFWSNKVEGKSVKSYLSFSQQREFSSKVIFVMYYELKNTFLEEEKNLNLFLCLFLGNTNAK